MNFELEILDSLYQVCKHPIALASVIDSKRDIKNRYQYCLVVWYPKLVLALATEVKLNYPIPYHRNATHISGYDAGNITRRLLNDAFDRSFF